MLARLRDRELRGQESGQTYFPFRRTKRSRMTGFSTLLAGDDAARMSIFLGFTTEAAHAGATPRGLGGDHLNVRRSSGLSDFQFRTSRARASSSCFGGTSAMGSPWSAPPPWPHSCVPTPFEMDLSVRLLQWMPICRRLILFGGAVRLPRWSIALTDTRTLFGARWR